MEKNLKKNIYTYIYVYIYICVYIYIYISESLCCTPEISTTMNINSTSIFLIRRKKIFKKFNGQTALIDTKTKKIYGWQMSI